MKTKYLSIFGVLCAVALLVMLLPGAVFADDPTVVNVNWTGGGTVGTTVNSGDSNAGFNTGGSSIAGTYTATDSNNNPYNYSVDSFSSYLNANVTDGFIETGMARVSSYVPMYGNGGQIDYAFVAVTDGTGSMAFRSTTNYAQLVNASYGYQLPGGHNVVVNATGYVIDRSISDGRGNSAFLQAAGTGSATLDCMSSEASGVWDLKLGRGAGCYTDANFQATGTGGYFNVTGVGNSSVVFNGLGISSGGGTLSVTANWLNNFSINDYSLTAH